MVARSSPVSSAIRALTTRPPSSMSCRVRRRRSTCHVRMSCRALAAWCRLRATRLRRSAFHVAVRFWRNLPRSALKERGPAPGPCLPLSGLSCLSQDDQRAGQFVGVECVSPRGDDQFTKLLHFTALEVTRLVPKCLQFGIEVPWFAHRRLHECRGEMIVERTAQCCKVARTAWDAVVPPEIFSREGALIRRADVRFAV